MADKENNILFEKIANQNDKVAFSRFFKLYHSRLIQFALMYVWSYKDAEDVVSEVMIKLLRQRKKICEIKNCEGYLYSAIKNQALNLLKKNNRKSLLFTTDIPQDYLTNSYVQPLDAILEKELRLIITKVVEDLPPKRKIVYKMIKDEEFKIKEVAEFLCIAEKTVKKHLELAMKDLRKAIEAFYIEKESDTPLIKMPGNKSMMISFLLILILI